MHWYFLFGAFAHAELHVLNCCKFAKFNNRDYERTGSMYLGGKTNGTEVPMYTSVGSAENNGHLVSMVWQNKPNNDGSSIAWPILSEAKMEDLGTGAGPTMMLEEIAWSEEKLRIDGKLVCPDELKWVKDNKEEEPWRCDEEKTEECTDKLETCPTIAPKNKCQTLAKICCLSCQIYEANRTAEAEAEAEAEADVNKISISGGLEIPIQVSPTGGVGGITGGAFAGEVLTVETVEDAEVDEHGHGHDHGHDHGHTKVNETEEAKVKEASSTEESSAGTLMPYVNFVLTLFLCFVWV